MDSIKKINCALTEASIVEFIRKHCKDKAAIIGLSGGIDSAVVARLCTLALGRENVILVSIPYETRDEYLQSIFCKQFNQYFITHYLATALDEDNRLVFGNYIARMRMATLYYYANKHNGLVIGTTNKSEWLTGYFTKYGDGGVDIEPIIGLYKTQVYQLARYLGVPQEIIDAKPTAGLWEGQTDEEELGMTYEELDKILEYENNHPVVSKLVNNSQHKRDPIPGHLEVFYE